MSTFRTLLYMLGAWVGGILVTLLVLAQSWPGTVLWAVLSVTLAAGLAGALWADSRAAGAPR